MGRAEHSRTTVRARTGLGLLAAFTAALLCVVEAGAGQEPVVGVEHPVKATASWKVIVHPANAMRSIGRDQLERIYLKRSRFWPDESAILALNLPAGDPLRLSFSAEVLRADEDRLSTYWNRQYFQGVAPPVVLQSSKAVRAYVASTPNAIGYVSAGDVDESVAAVEVDDAH